MITRETAKPRYETMQLELHFAEPVERLMDNLVEVAERRRRRRRRRTLMWLCALVNYYCRRDFAALRCDMDRRHLLRKPAAGASSLSSTAPGSDV